MLLHGFIKKPQHMHDSDIELALKRFKEWQRGET
jgi:phage-related protein